MIKALHSNNAVSEIIGTVLLLGMAVALFSVIYYIVLTPYQSTPLVNARFFGEVENDTIIITHYGGESIVLSDSNLSATIDGNIVFAFELTDTNSNGKWDIGEKMQYQHGNILQAEVSVTVTDKISNSILFVGTLQEEGPGILPLSLDTSINSFSQYLVTDSELSISASGDSRLSLVELWYRYSQDNATWSGNRTIGEVRIIENVDTSWVHVDFWNSYTKPVIVSTYNLATYNNNEACVRIRNVDSSGCDIKIQNPGDDHSITSDDVHLLIVEQGQHYLNDGRKIEAYRYAESATARSSNWGYTGTAQTYSHSYSTPVVLGSVMSFNDSDWSVPYFTDGATSNPPDAQALYTSKHVGADSDTTRNTETIGYIIFEQGTGSIEGIDYKAALGSDSVDGPDNSGYAYSLGGTYSVGLATQGGMDGSDGSWAVLYGSNPVGSSLTVACEEDTITDTERAHTTEQVSYIVFSSVGNITSNESAGTGWLLWNHSSNPDSNSPWNWNFNYPNGPGYYQFYSFGKNDTNTETAPLTADQSCQFLLSSTVDAISPYSVSTSPLDVTATAFSGYDNVSLYYRFSEDNSSWTPSSINCAWLQGTTLSDGTTNLNQNSFNVLKFDSAFVDDSYYSFSSSSPTRLTVNQNGDYLIAFTLPMQRSDAKSARTCLQTEIYVNDVKQDVGVARSSYIRLASYHSESSNHHNVLLEGLSINDYIEVKVKGITSRTGSSYPIVTSEAFSLYVEYISSNETVFSALSTETTYSTNLNQNSAYELEWVEGRKDTGFQHSDSSNPEDITLQATGNYLVYVNIPLGGSVSRANIRGKILIDGMMIDGGMFSQGYIRNHDNHRDSSIHWSGVVSTTSANKVLSVSVQREANAGTITVDGEKATLFIQKLPDEPMLITKGSTLSSGSNWNPSSKVSIQWTNDIEINSTIFTHSESSNSHEITVLDDGDYHLVYNGAFSSTSSSRPNNRIYVEVNGQSISGAETKSNYVRNANGHNDVSSCLSFLLRGLSSGDTIVVYTIREANSPTVNDVTDSLLFLWKKQTSSNQNWTIWSDSSNPDELSPWTWSFPLSRGSGYYEFYSIAQFNNDVESAPASADTRCHYV